MALRAIAHLDTEFAIELAILLVDFFDAFEKVFFSDIQLFFDD